MDTATEFAVHTGDRCTAMEVAGAALRSTGHHVESTGGTLTATAGSRLLTILLGALAHPSREYRRYELSMTVDGASTTITLRRAGHVTAVSGGSIGANRRRADWQEVTAAIESAFRTAGVLAVRTDTGSHRTR
ncbi:hypothetical protein [Curtobacterium sp. VKM Ac-1376]|uniref:hypothetical protein n=1 Tax=Curtobacterium sp. VKM Ac-1376 TaxID=123312 RepID=UPI00188A433D|nr:hypothetical protein [Curtobacterium sp. VKM Ac-1376]MBF4613667.1 hypothetical protein [Curtobacterium sp. VKM Ac-1376]